MLHCAPVCNTAAAGSRATLLRRSTAAPSARVSAGHVCSINSTRGAAAALRATIAPRQNPGTSGRRAAVVQAAALEPRQPWVALAAHQPGAGAAAAALQLAQTAHPSSSWQLMAQQMIQYAGMVAMAVGLALISPGAADAARSGGRMGGSSFGSRSGGGGFGGGSGFGGGAAASAFGSSPLSGGFGGSRAGFRSSSSSVSMNSFFMSPFGMGYPMYGGGGSGVLSLMFWGVFAVLMIGALQGLFRGGNDNTNDDGYYGGRGGGDDYEEVLTVAKVQVGLLGSARELQKDLERIADQADTDTPEGLHYILQETVLALMRNPDYCLYGFAKSKRERSAEDAETQFNQVSLQERSKFQAETLVNVGGRTGRSSMKGAYTQGDKELIVVTLIVAAEGNFKLPKVDSRTSLKQALAMMGACRSEDLLAVEVLWTPEEEGDYFTVEDLAYDYPTLNTL